MSILANCPFCGAWLISHRTDGKTWLRRVCGECDAEGPVVEGSPERIKTWERADYAWNTRPVQATEAGTAETGTGSVHEGAVGKADAPDEIERLRAALRDMLKCTPFIKHDPRGNGWATIVYDCGDPWEIARAALGDQP